MKWLWALGFYSPAGGVRLVSGRRSREPLSPPSPSQAWGGHRAPLGTGPQVPVGTPTHPVGYLLGLWLPGPPEAHAGLSTRPGPVGGQRSQGMSEPRGATDPPRGPQVGPLWQHPRPRVRFPGRWAHIFQKAAHTPPGTPSLKFLITLLLGKPLFQLPKLHTVNLLTALQGEGA